SRRTSAKPTFFLQKKTTPNALTPWTWPASTIRTARAQTRSTSCTPKPSTRRWASVQMRANPAKRHFVGHGRILRYRYQRCLALSFEYFALGSVLECRSYPNMSNLVPF
ncbi:MAG: hypothetical protein BJ554DRAFT_4604, partial [Olpidium bornovanus]